MPNLKETINVNSFNQTYSKKSLHNADCRLEAINSHCKPFGTNNDGFHLTFKHLERIWSEGFSARDEVIIPV